MGRHIGALRHVADVAQIALVDDLPVIVAIDAVDFHGLALVDKIEERRKGIAQAHASTAAVADVEHPFHFVECCIAVEERGVAPVDRVAGGRFERSFTYGHGGSR